MGWENMAFADVVRYLLQWGLIGSAVFSIFVIVVFRTGIVYTAREDDGTLKGKMPTSGLLSMLVTLLGIIALQVLANYYGLFKAGFDLSFIQLYLLNFAYYLILFAYDTFVIDYLVISLWRPSFLKIPTAMDRESMKEHITKSIPVGLIAGILLSGISTLVAFYLF